MTDFVDPSPGYCTEEKDVLATAAANLASTGEALDHALALHMRAAIAGAGGCCSLDCDEHAALVEAARIVNCNGRPIPDESAANLTIAVVGNVAYQRSDGDWYPAGDKAPHTWLQLVRMAWESGQDRPEVVWES